MFSVFIYYLNKHVNFNVKISSVPIFRIKNKFPVIESNCLPVVQFQFTGRVLIYIYDSCYDISSKSIARMTLSTIKAKRSERVEGLKHIRMGG